MKISVARRLRVKLAILGLVLGTCVTVVPAYALADEPGIAIWLTIVALYTAVEFRRAWIQLEREEKK